MCWILPLFPMYESPIVSSLARIFFTFNVVIAMLVLVRIFRFCSAAFENLAKPSFLLKRLSPHPQLEAEKEGRYGGTMSSNDQLFSKKNATPILQNNSYDIKRLCLHWICFGLSFQHIYSENAIFLYLYAENN
jgi:hypothetical protein